MVIIDVEHDPDSSRNTWEKWFQVIYRNKFGRYLDLIDIQDTETSKPKRFYAKFNENIYPELRREYPKFKMAGDCDFNFNEKKVREYERLLKGEEHSLLTECANMHHNPYNFSFMPITGNLQAVKGSDKFDRFDRFLCLLSKYYKQKFFKNKEKCQLLCRATKANKPVLMKYLDSFKSVSEYCREIYFINDSFVQKLIANCNDDIRDKKTAIQYMNLAKEYWEIRKIYFREKLNIEF